MPTQVRPRELFLPLKQLKVVIMKRFKLQFLKHMNWFLKHTDKNSGAGEKGKNVEYVQGILVNFTRWCSASNMHDLFVLEQFKSTLPPHLATYTNEKKVTTTSSAAVLAD